MKILDDMVFETQLMELKIASKAVDLEDEMARTGEMPIFILGIDDCHVAVDWFMDKS